MCQPHPDRPFRTALIGVLFAAGIGLGQYVEDSIDVGGAWVGSLAYNSRADVVYGRVQDTQGRFFAIDCASNEVTASFTQPWPRYIAYDSTDNKAYCSFTAGGEDSVLVVDGTTHQRLRAVSVSGAVWPVWDPVGDRLYVSGGDHANLVTVIGCRADTVVAVIATGACPLKMHVNTLRRKLYVQNYDGCSVSVVDLNTNQVIRTIPLGSEPQSGYYCEWADKYFSDCGVGSGRVAVISGADDSIVARIPLPALTSANAFTGVPSSGLVMVAAYGGGTGTVHAIDPALDSIVGTVTVGRNPRALLWSPASDLGYCANGTSDNLSILRDDGSLVASLPVGDAPFAMACSRPSRRLYVGHFNTDCVYVIRDELGVAEEPHARAPARPVVGTVARRVLLWKGSAAQLTDITGRGVAELRPGSVGIAGLSPGVYFVVTPTSTGSIPSAPQKVVITR